MAYKDSRGQILHDLGFHLKENLLRFCLFAWKQNKS